MAIKDDERRDLIAGKLRAHRAESALSQAELGELVNVDKSSISKYERGVACADYETMWDLADLYGVSLDELGGRVFEKATAD